MRTGDCSTGSIEDRMARSDVVVSYGLKYSKITV